MASTLGHTTHSPSKTGVAAQTDKWACPMRQGMARYIVKRAGYISESIASPDNGVVSGVVKVDVVDPREVDNQVAVSATEAIGGVGMAARAGVDCDEFEQHSAALCASGGELTRDALRLTKILDEPGNVFCTVRVSDGGRFEV